MVVNSIQTCISYETFKMSSGEMKLSNTAFGMALDATTIKVPNGYFISNPFGGKS